MQITAASQQQRADDLAFRDLGYAKIGFVIRTSFELNAWVKLRMQRLRGSSYILCIDTC
jgi:hypothetical protein